MTPQRARYVLDHKLIGGELRTAFIRPGDSPTKKTHADGITPAEHAAIMELWKTLPGSSSYYSAVCEIARPTF